MPMTPSVYVYRVVNRNPLQRWTFSHIAGNGYRQPSTRTYLTRWDARRAVSRLYPGLPIRDGEWGNG